MEITIKIFRYNPEKDKRGHYETYKLEGDENDRVLDVLEYVKGTMDGTLSFRRSCGLWAWPSRCRWGSARRRVRTGLN